MFDRRYLHLPSNLGERSADAVARNVGSWRFVLIQNGLILLWMVLHLFHILDLDPWPFLFLNIVMSWQAANTGPILQMSSNRQASRDRARDDHEAIEVELLYTGQQQMAAMLTAIREINDRQTEILNTQTTVLDAIAKLQEGKGDGVVVQASEG